MDLLVKGYRCFSRTNPLRVSFRDGFIALVGPNNSGKSSLLRMFYELRNVFTLLRHEAMPVWSRNGSTVQSSFEGVLDPNEVFCDSETGDIELSFSDLPNHASDAAGQAKSFHITLSRSQPGYICSSIEWRGEPLPSGEIQYNHSNSTILEGTRRWDYSAVHELLKDLATSIYLGPFRNAINTGGASYFDVPVGTEFINQWHTWHVGPRKHENAAISRVVEQIRTIMGFERLEITSSKELNTLHVRTERGDYKLPELGAGIVQLIICLGRAAMTRPAYIFIDEPELNLHPSLQVDFLTSLASHGSRGVMYATHSMGLARSVADAVYSFRIRDGRSHMRPFEGDAGLAELLGEMGYSGFQELGCDRLLLVEGVTEVRTLQQWLRLFRAEHRVVCIPLGGSAMIRATAEVELGELARLRVPVSVLVDSEATTDGNPAKERTDFEEVCRRLGFDVHLTQRRATENYLTTPALVRAFGEGLSQLAPFALLKDYERAWKKADNWRAAREMTREELMETDIGAFLERVARAL